MVKIFDNFNSLDIMYKLYDMRESEDSAVFVTLDIRELLTELKRRKNQNGLNWDVDLLLSIEDDHDNPIAWVDVERFECFF